MSTSAFQNAGETVSLCPPVTQPIESTTTVSQCFITPVLVSSQSSATTVSSYQLITQSIESSTTMSQYSVAPVLVGSGVLTAKPARNWAGRRRPYLQQNRAVTARSAAVSASDKITELSAAKLELAKLRHEAEEERKNQALAEHELRMKFMQEEHEMKKKEHELRMLLLQAQLQRSQNTEE